MIAFPTHFFIPNNRNIAVGLSGGPDSMCLTHMLCEYIKQQDLPITVHALTVNHNLREGSLSEAEQVKDWAAEYPHLEHHIINWAHGATDSRIMEAARKARYELMSDFCTAHNIKDLYIAHHQDDQVETFLFRLSKGSGLDGLCGMQPLYEYTDQLTINRPLLDFPKEALIDYCHHFDIPFIDDPSNKKTEYARPRLRESRAALEKEGLSAKRISTTAKRLLRAKDALNWLCEKAISETFEVKRDIIEINLDKLSEYPKEIHVRILQYAISFLTPEREYSARMEKIESIAEDVLLEQSFRKQTFSKLIFERLLIDKSFHLVITKENE